MENNRQDSNQPENNPPRPPSRSFNFWIILILVGSLLAFWVMSSLSLDESQISWSYFQKLVDGQGFDGEVLKNAEGEPIGCMIETAVFGDKQVSGTFKNFDETVALPAEPVRDSSGKVIEPKKDAKLKQKYYTNIPLNPPSRDKLRQQLEEAGVWVSFDLGNNVLNYYTIMLILFSIGLVLLMFMTMRRAQNSMMGGGGFLSNFSRSPAKRYEASAEPITFKDVAGLEGVKADLQEIVEFLKDPTRFQKLGGRVPKGVLLIGPPGTGKTLLARAVAGEAEAPYFSVNGSEFIQMFVGVGASRVRDLFATAKAQSPAIIFIDEIDAVGRQRGAGLGGGHDEREQTLNQILGEMDGFQATESVIVVAATNRPDVLDPALLRPGRFDRHVTVSRPTLAGREAIFKVHVRDVPLAESVDLAVLAQATAGMTGADIQNLVNEAALWAARHNKKKVEMSDFYYSHDKVLMGAKREEVLTDLEKERTAVHEAGHTLAAWKLIGANPVHKVTIIPRGRSLGVTQMVPDEDRMNLSEEEIRHNLVVMLAGRAAEKLMYDEFTVGAENDLERATSMARRMVTHWGMSQKLGPVSYKMTDEDPFLGREIHQNRQFSEHTMEVIDDEVTLILQKASEEAFALLEQHRDDLKRITDGLLAKEELDRNEITELIGPSVHAEKKLLAKEADSKSATSNGAPAAESLADPDAGDESKPEATDSQNGSVSQAPTEDGQSTTS
ncbi:MAG: ATP-dependent zinc metalloprotease FtsH [Mariniblastus sp.]|nr:ATP-dependent zinc metalloprotease FtsH [Mariniblastus sp.]